MLKSFICICRIFCLPIFLTIRYIAKRCKQLTTINNDDITVTMTTFSHSNQDRWVGSDQFTLTTLEEAKYWRNWPYYIERTYIVVVIYVESLVHSSLNKCSSKRASSWMNFGRLSCIVRLLLQLHFFVDVILNAKRGSGYMRLVDCWKWSMLFIEEILLMSDHQQ